MAVTLALGSVLGFLGGMLGIGGGLLAIPILGIVYGLDQQHAQGTAMLMVAPNVILGLARYVRRGDLDRRLALVLACSALPVTYLGATLAVHVASASLRRGFAIFLFFLAAWFVLRSLRNGVAAQTARKPAAVAWAVPIGAVGGAISGAFSIGGAVFAVPLLGIVYGLTQATAQGLGLALVAPGTLVAIGAYGFANDISWSLGIPLAIGGACFVGRGVDVAHRLPENTLRLIFSFVLIVSGASLLLRA